MLRMKIAAFAETWERNLAMLLSCAGCDKPIMDKFLFNVVDRAWHADCVRCCDCRNPLHEKCFSREAKLFCRKDFFKRYGTKCGGCLQGINPSDLVRKARDKVFHLNCFTCLVCRKQMTTGEELYIVDDSTFVCKEDYLLRKPSMMKHHIHGHHGEDSYIGSGSEDEDEENHGGENQLPNSVRASRLGLNNIAHSLHRDHSIGTAGDSSHGLEPCKLEDSEDQGSLDGDPETHDSQTENKSPDGGNGASSGDGGASSKRRGPRTTIKAKQLEILKTAFSQTPKPTRHIREQLAKETGLPMRVIQVWFQNKRSKERRLKQLTSMGRSPFFGGARKMRGFPLNLSHAGIGTDDGHSTGFSYFSDKFDFSYATPVSFHHDFFGAQPPANTHEPTFGCSNDAGSDTVSMTGMTIVPPGVPGDYLSRSVESGSTEFLSGTPVQGSPVLPNVHTTEFISSTGGGPVNPDPGSSRSHSIGGSNMNSFPESHPMQKNKGIVW